MKNSETCTFCKKEVDLFFSIKEHGGDLIYCGYCMEKFIKENNWKVDSDCRKSIEDAKHTVVGGVM